MAAWSYDVRSSRPSALGRFHPAARSYVFANGLQAGRGPAAVQAVATLLVRLVRRRDHLIRMGLARRRGGATVEPEAGETDDAADPQSGTPA